MTPTTSSPSIMLLNPVAQSGNSTVTTTAEASSDEALSGFQLLLGNLQQQLPMAAGDGDTLDKNADSTDLDGGNALPLLGTVLPSVTLPQAASDESAQASETETKDKKDSDVEAATIDGMAPVVIMPLTPYGSAAKTAESALMGADIALQATGADNQASTVDANGNKVAVVTANPVANTTTGLPDVAAANTAATAANSTAVLNEVQGVSKATTESDFDELLKHFDPAAPTERSSASAIGAGTGISAHQASRTYFDAANNTTSISVPVGSSGWSDAVTDKVMWFSANKITSAEIHLNPPDLGPLQVRVSTQHDQASVVFTSQHAAVRDALDQALPRLRDMLGNQGMQLLDVSVGGQGAQQQQQQFSHNGTTDRGAGSGGLFGDDPTESTAVSVTAIDTARLLRSGFDAYA